MRQKLSYDMKEDIDKNSPSSEPTLLAFHTEMEIPNHEIVSMKEEENAKSDWKDKYFFIGKNFLMKMSGKKSEPPEQKEPKTPIDDVEDNARSAPTDINHIQFWKDVSNFRKYLKGRISE